METRLAGTTLAGRYDLIELLGAGGMGEVYRARDRELDELVALKVIRGELADAPEVVARFRHEVKLARRVTHANVARTFELGQAGGAMYCTMQLVEGESLAHRLERERRLAVADAAAIAYAVCEALIAAHAADVIHRDIKPANVLIANDGRVVLADFGIAAVRVADEVDTSGTPAYMAPEQARGEPPTPATDVYAVGVLLHEMVCGHRAFTGGPASIFDAKQRVERLVVTAPDVPPELAAVIGRATARDVGERTATAAELRAAIAPWRRAAAAPSPGPARTGPAITERTVLVVAPGGERAPGERAPGVDPAARAIHEELLAALGRSRIRVLTRSIDGEPPDFTVRFAPGDGTVALTATRAGEPAPAVALHLPLAIEHVPRSVALAATTVAALFGDPPARGDAAYELFVRARYEARRSPSVFREPLAMLERADALRPGDARIRASMALMLSRGTFFDPDRSLIERAGEHARFALAHGPELAESHLAAGHVQLQTGDPVAAAAHYRVAIACSPHSAEAHDYLGRMLLEAGYLDAALARFDVAIAISPDFRIVELEVARALALERRWDEHDRLLAGQSLADRPIARARIAWWRGELALVREYRAQDLFAGVFDGELVTMLLDAILEGGWYRVRDALVAKAADERFPSHRRRAFIAQLVAEAAAHGGDVAACTAVLAGASRNAQLYDLHWLDRCPMLECVRGSPGFAEVRAEILARSRAIYDALYSDHAIAHGTTALATG